MTNTPSLIPILKFIDAAQKSRKYLPGTANNLRRSIKILESSLNEQEKGSLDLVSEHIDQIFYEYYQQNQASVSASSVETYKSRVKKAIRDYQKYGLDPSKMVSWNPKISIKSKRVEPKNNEMVDAQHATNEHAFDKDLFPNMLRTEIPLTSDLFAILLVPKPLSKSKEHLDIISDYVELLKKHADRIINQDK